MKKLFVILLAVVAFAGVYAQSAQEEQPRPKGPSIEDFFKMKLDFVINDLKLEPADSAKFAPLYRDYQQAKGELMREASKGRVIGRKLMKRETITDQDYLSATHGELDFKLNEAELAKTWFAKFEEVLSPKQLFTLLRSEERFAAEMMKNHGRRGHKGQGKTEQQK